MPADLLIPPAAAVAAHLRAHDPSGRTGVEAFAFHGLAEPGKLVISLALGPAGLDRSARPADFVSPVPDRPVDGPFMDWAAAVRSPETGFPWYLGVNYPRFMAAEELRPFSPGLPKADLRRLGEALRNAALRRLSEVEPAAADAALTLVLDFQNLGGRPEARFEIRPKSFTLKIQTLGEGGMPAPPSWPAVALWSAPAHRFQINFGFPPASAHERAHALSGAV